MAAQRTRGAGTGCESHARSWGLHIACTLHVVSVSVSAQSEVQGVCSEVHAQPTCVLRMPVQANHCGGPCHAEDRLPLRITAQGPGAQRGSVHSVQAAVALAGGAALPGLLDAQELTDFMSLPQVLIRYNCLRLVCGLWWQAYEAQVQVTEAVEEVELLRLRLDISEQVVGDLGLWEQLGRQAAWQAVLASKGLLRHLCRACYEVLLLPPDPNVLHCFSAGFQECYASVSPAGEAGGVQPGGQGAGRGGGHCGQRPCSPARGGSRPVQGCEPGGRGLGLCWPGAACWAGICSIGRDA